MKYRRLKHPNPIKKWGREHWYWECECGMVSWKPTRFSSMAFSRTTRKTTKDAYWEHRKSEEHKGHMTSAGLVDTAV